MTTFTNNSIGCSRDRENTAAMSGSALSPVLQFFYLGVAATAFIGGIMVLTNFTFTSVIVGGYVMFFAVVLFFVQIRCPEIILNNAGFLFSYLGRGFFYIFIGCLVLQGDTVEDIPGGVVIAAGCLCIIFRFIKDFPTLSPITGRDPHADASINAPYAPSSDSGTV